MTAAILDLPDPEYFAHPALSHSDAKLLLDCPARYRYIKQAGPLPYKAEFEWGHAVHELVLGKGPGIIQIDYDDWRSKTAREERDAAIAEGRTPLLYEEYGRALDCADAVRQHPLAAKLLDHLDHAEITAIWDDDDIQRKAKLDGICGRFGIDLKTTQNAATDAFGRSAGTYAYASQDAWYRDALRTCFDIADPKFLFVVVEKHPPYLVNVIELDPYDVELGGRRNRAALDLYRRCRDRDEWPAYGDGINVAQLPRWAELEMEAM